ncbi:Zinc finger Ran-binding domain-containing protein 2 [Phytophthora pseudosyringae]|uniref:Zinc finger Ran-binding domain-containing protein 2 n=1 Tax=Phytophthora pseudosyringae TaxID=221518 RepID=A0A8T1WDZ8_9STRA|nr:Zinc finger Ran-binding domain-containing protein 2 [Phytophthora pseudosyringae]
MGTPSRAAACSSLNGPFCAGFGSGFAVAPLHARQNLDVDEEELEVTEAAKTLKIEKVLKEYELQAATSEAAALEEEQDIILDIEMLLDESMALLSELEEGGDDKSPMAGAFAFSSADGAFELLERMDGDELKEFFETALDEVLLSVEAALQELSPGAPQGVRTTARQLMELQDYSNYKFTRLDETQLASIRYKFANHRLVELQQTFERLVIARNAQDRQLAYETAVFLFQLAQEEAIGAKESAKEPEADTTTAVRDATDTTDE